MTDTTRATRGLMQVVVVAGAATLACLSFSSPASAQSEECKPLMKLMQERIALVQRLNTMNKAKRKDPNEFCAVFTQLSSKISQAIPEVEKNGAWCHVPDQALTGLKGELGQANSAKAQACKVAAQQKKMQAQQEQQSRSAPGPLGGGDSIVGGPIKMPAGAL
ncbi:hypothetical protein [Alsobacter sp. R-9]